MNCKKVIRLERIKPMELGFREICWF